jgi:SAM-dependent methyltransferase
VISLRSSEELFLAVQGLEPERAIIDPYVKQQTSVTFFCVVCESMRTGSIRQPIGEEWVDLRDQVFCSHCGFNCRARLLYDVIEQSVGLPRGEIEALIFERVTPLYGLLKQAIPRLVGAEYGGPDLAPGTTFEARGLQVRHEDMQGLSFEDQSLDLVIHSDVLEHVPDPFQGMADVRRVLRTGGKCIFACPVYSVLEHRRRGFLDSDGQLRFTGEPAYHGDPIRAEGAPVFYEFGLSLLDDLNRLGFDARAVMYHSIARGYFSNDNPYVVGLMWPLVFVCTKI